MIEVSSDLREPDGIDTTTGRDVHQAGQGLLMGQATAEVPGKGIQQGGMPWVGTSVVT